MLNDYEAKGQIYLALGYTDLRKGIDGLCSLVQEQYGKELRTHDLFLFCGRRTDRIKGILWEGEGFLLGGRGQRHPLLSRRNCQRNRRGSLRLLCLHPHRGRQSSRG